MSEEDEHISDQEDFVQDLSSGEDEEDAKIEELEQKMELSYKQRLEELSQGRRSRPESSSTNGGGCRGSTLGVGIARLRSAQMRPSDLKQSSLNNPYSQASMSNPNLALEEACTDGVNYTTHSVQLLPEVIEEESPLDLMTRFSKFVNTKNVGRDAFCKAVNLYLTMEELYQAFNLVNFTVGKDEIF